MNVQSLVGYFPVSHAKIKMTYQLQKYNHTVTPLFIFGCRTIIFFVPPESDALTLFYRKSTKNQTMKNLPPSVRCCTIRPTGAPESFLCTVR